MDQRWTERRSMRLDVALHTQGRPATVCKSRNLSLEGMYLEIDARALDLDVGTTVELDLQLPADTHGRRHSATAVVRHCDDVGVGLLFTAVPTQLSMGLRAAIEGTMAVALDSSAVR